jgi:hypothetical protein
VYPKYIASTATIRAADKQVKKLYGREAAVFPPPGITCDNSYFAKTVPLEEKPGRLYLGYHAPLLGRKECLAPLAAALLAAPAALFADRRHEEILLDAWWTTVVYHGSLKGLANSRMLFDAAIRERLTMMMREMKADPDFQRNQGKDNIVKLLEKRVVPSIEELTSHKTAAENEAAFSRLKRPYPQDGHLDVALATNMVSVGLDVGRLALMVINGQPLTTAEYIQAGSRVGRKDVPGVVFVNYYRDQTRSLSHYEQFRAYHDAFYRYVEPTSVTPFTWQARNKALHAALVSVMRHGIEGVPEASCFSEELPKVQKALEILKNRCADADELLAQDAHKHIEDLAAAWALAAQQCAAQKSGFKYYSGQDRASKNLLCNYDDAVRGIWPTLQSMRNVEDTALLKEILPNGVKSKHLPVRFSHLLGYSGVGAIVRGPHSLMVVEDASTWTDKDGKEGDTEMYYVERVRYALGISKKLKAPPAAKERQNGSVDGICVPAIRFPRWMRCPKCGRLYPQRVWKTQQTVDPVCADPADNDPRKCRGTKLEQIHYVMTHPKGYLADVSWHLLTHKGANLTCKRYDQLVLAQHENDHQWRLRCEACGSETRFDENEPQRFGNANEQPWLYDRLVPEEDRGDLKAKIRKVNDATVYSPVTASALVIPPESRLRAGAPVDKLYRNSNDREQLARARTDYQRKSQINILASKYRCSIGDIESAMKKIEEGYPYYGKEFPRSRLCEDEYKAFLDDAINASDGEDFVPRRLTKQWREFVERKEHPKNICGRTGIIQELVKVDRLKEVRVFMGFKREEGDTVAPGVSENLDWLPAIELYGEGIFFTLDEAMLAAWEQNDRVIARFSPIQRRFAASGREEPQIMTPRFILLHTLSHLIIRQLEASGGYPAASLTERLYCASKTQGTEPMAGILIYTTAPDKSGTLGGLAELANPGHFGRIFSQALDHAAWCSSDPVCREHEGQGPDLLNLAACHACALIPDTACAHNNILLDRVMVRGDRISRLPSLFDAAAP